MTERFSQFGSKQGREADWLVCVSHLLGTLGMPHPVDSDIDAVLQTSWANTVPVHHLVSPRCVLNPHRLGKMHGAETHGSSLMATILINAVPSRNKDPAPTFPCEYRHTKSGSSSGVHSALQRYVGESLGSPASGQKLHIPSSGYCPLPRPHFSQLETGPGSL